MSELQRAPSGFLTFRTVALLSRNERAYVGVLFDFLGTIPLVRFSKVLAADWHERQLGESGLRSERRVHEQRARTPEMVQRPEVVEVDLDEISFAQSTRGVRIPVRIVENDEAAWVEYLDGALGNVKTVGAGVDDNGIEL